ncbi:MAG: carbonate dehydratase [Sneathiella sp.]|nr:MAG: carbonate dehydratase [Sneathiella sp.]
MSRFFKMLLILSASILYSGASTAADTNNWSYDGPTGPANWANLGTAFLACDGQQQSPVVLRSASAIAADVPTVFLNWQQFAPDIINDGHKIEVTPQGEGGSLTFDGADYSLQDFHFHMTSEHQVDGQSFPMEAHFIHRSASGSLLALAVFFIEGQSNDVLDVILKTVPKQEGRASSPDFIDPKQLLPIDTRFFRYRGSLTFPPCSENVTWHIYKQPIEASKAQLDRIARLYKDNHRPLQELHRRYILEGK